MKNLLESRLRSLVRNITEAEVEPELYRPPRLQRVRKRPGRRTATPEHDPSAAGAGAIETAPEVLDPLDNPDDPDFRAGGEWGVPGQEQTAAAFRSRFGKPGLYNADGGKVKKWETEKVAARTNQVQPDRLIAYSRGAGVYNQTRRDEPSMPKDVPVTYVAPSSYRRWSDAPVPKAAPGSLTVIGDDDKIVSFKQACKNAVEAGTRLYIQPGYSHTGIMYSGGDIDQDAFEVDPRGCVADPDMPDWGNAPRGTPEQHEQQQQQVMKHVKNEAAIRSLVREILKGR